MVCYWETLVRATIAWSNKNKGPQLHILAVFSGTINYVVHSAKMGHLESHLHEDG